MAREVSRRAAKAEKGVEGVEERGGGMARREEEERRRRREGGWWMPSARANRTNAANGEVKEGVRTARRPM